jgi:3-deoxy-manno-octulosonate cytidylyltransferase (CMP-KDO synthetase)
MAQTESAQAPMTTLIYKNSDMTQFDDPNVVKVVVSDDGHAIYFSRAAIPHDREAHRRGVPSAPFWQHLGVYAFSRDGLHAFCSLPSSKLEQIERLEQLRAVSAGWRIKVCEAASKSIGIDTPEDLERARARFHG